MIGQSGPRHFNRASENQSTDIRYQLGLGLAEFAERSTSYGKTNDASKQSQNFTNEEMETAYLAAISYLTPLRQHHEYYLSRILTALAKLPQIGRASFLILANHNELRLQDTEQILSWFDAVNDESIRQKTARTLGGKGAADLLKALAHCQTPECIQSAKEGFLSRQITSRESGELLALLRSQEASDLHAYVARALGKHNHGVVSTVVAAFPAEIAVEAVSASIEQEKLPYDANVLVSFLANPKLETIHEKLGRLLGLRGEMWLSVVLNMSQDPAVRRAACEGYLERSGVEQSVRSDFRSRHKVQYQALAQAITSTDKIIVEASSRALSRLPFEKSTLPAVVSAATNSDSPLHPLVLQILQEWNPKELKKLAAGAKGGVDFRREAVCAILLVSAGIELLETIKAIQIK